MKWIKTWAKIDENTTYLVMAVPPKWWTKRVYQPQILQPQILQGWQVTRLIEGLYVATEFFPPKTIEECE